LSQLARDIPEIKIGHFGFGFYPATVISVPVHRIAMNPYYIGKLLAAHVSYRRDVSAIFEGCDSDLREMISR
jgi:hypothetical protein